MGGMSVKEAPKAERAPKAEKAEKADKPQKSEKPAKAEEPKRAEPRDEVDLKESKEDDETGSSSEHISALEKSLGRELKADKRQGEENCIDNAAREARDGDTALFFADRDKRDQNDAGHVVLQRGESIVDPTAERTYRDLAHFQSENPQYAELVGKTDARTLSEIVNAPDEASRIEVLRRAGLENLADQRFADVPPVSQNFLEASDQLESAQARVEKANQDAMQGLGNVAGSLTDEQLGAYMQQYQRNNPAYAQEAAASHRMAETFRTEGDVIAGMAAKDEQFRELALEAARGVVGANQPNTEDMRAVLQWGTDHIDQMDEEFVRRWKDEVIGPAMPTLVAEAQAGSNEDVARLKGLFNGPMGLADIREAVDHTMQYDRLVQHYRGDHELALRDLKGRLEGELGPHSATKGFLSAGLVLANGAGALDNWDQGKYTKVLADLAGTGEDALDLVRPMIKSAPLQKMAGRLVPVLGMVSAAASLKSNWDEWTEERRALSLVKCGGDLLSVTGQGLTAAGLATGPGAALLVPVGQTMNGVGTVISTLGEAADLVVQSEDQKRKAYQALSTAVPGAAADLWNNRDNLAELRNAGLSAEQTQQFLRAFPELGQGSGLDPAAVSGLAGMSRTLGIPADRFSEFTSALLEEGRAYGKGPLDTTRLLTMMLSAGANGSVSASDWFRQTYPKTYRRYGGQ